MKLVYISHPYTGDEVKNIESAREYCRKIKRQYPHWALFNPLDNHKYAHNEPYKHDDYMAMDIEILKRCDIVIFCGNWERSKGCMAEYKEAKRLKKEIYFERVNKS